MPRASTYFSPVISRADAHAVAACAADDARMLELAKREARGSFSQMRRDAARFETRRLQRRIVAAADALIAFNAQSEET